MKRLFLCILAMLLLLTAACEKEPPVPTQPQATTPTQAQTEPTVPTQPTDPLSLFREEMKPPIMAVADFGFPTLSEDFGILDYLMDEYPAWMAEHDFIAAIPQERTVLTCQFDDWDAWGNLLCIVPRDPMATLSVTVARYTDDEMTPTEEVAYRSETGEPILLLADISDGIDISVVITDGNGQSISWVPYWEFCEVLSGDGTYGSHVMYFSPVSEKTAYQKALDSGWVVPDRSFLADHYWWSDYGYSMVLYYNPGQIYDGIAYLYEDDGTGVHCVTYHGNWQFKRGNLYLNMKHVDDGTVKFQGDFPILVDSDGNGWLAIFRTENGIGLPQFFDGIEYDELAPMGSDATSPYENALYEGFRQPEAEELVNTAWVSLCNYAIDLNDDGVPGNNGGEAVLYDINEDGGYIQSYTGTWQLEGSMLHLLLIPENEDGVFIDDSFPILILDEKLWIGRNEYGNCLPWFYDDLMADVLTIAKG